MMLMCLSVFRVVFSFYHFGIVQESICLTANNIDYDVRVCVFSCVIIVYYIIFTINMSELQFLLLSRLFFVVFFLYYTPFYSHLFLGSYTQQFDDYFV